MAMEPEAGVVCWKVEEGTGAKECQQPLETVKVSMCAPPLKPLEGT